MADSQHNRSTEQRDAELEKEIADALGDRSMEELMEEAAEPVERAHPAEAEAPADETGGGEASPEASDEAEPPVGEQSQTRLGTIAAVRGEDVFVEFGGKDQGVCPLGQFEKTPRVGEHLEFVVESYEASEGLLKLRKPGATAKADWKTLSKGMVIEALVTGMNTGGLELKVAGKRAFMPASQIGLHRVEDFRPYLQRKLRCRVTELDRRRRRIVLSRRSVLAEEEKRQRRELLRQIEPGQMREGTVRRIQKFGVFVELEPGIDGLVHVSDMGWGHIEDPGEVVQVGQKVQVKVLKVRDGGQRISLGIKQAQPDPWDAVGSRYPVGEKVKGTVTRTTDFGAFVELEPGVEGLIHISQLSDQRVNRVTQVVRPGQEIEAKVLQFDPERRRLGLSVRALVAPEQAAPGRPTREDLRRYVKRAEDAHAGESLGALMAKLGESGERKGGIG